MTIKTIIFDLGGVIIELDFARFFKEVIEISPLHKPHSSLLLEFWRQSDIYHQGKITDEVFYHQACELLKVCDLNQEEFYKSFNSVISRINYEVIELIKKLKQTKKFKLLLLSNINQSHWEYGKIQKWDFVDLFDDLLLSFQLYVTKPDPRIYQLAIQRANCKPDEILFIDDGLNNVHSAEEVGINAFHFTNIEELIDKLKELNIL